MSESNSRRVATRPARSIFRIDRHIARWIDPPRVGAVIGAHAGGFNTGTSGVALIGDFTATEPTYRGRSAVMHYMAFKLGINGVDPLTNVRITVDRPRSTRSGPR